jgi:transposase
MKTPQLKYKPYPSDVSDEEWSFVAPYLALNRADGENRRHDVRAVFNALRWRVPTRAATPG